MDLHSLVYETNQNVIWGLPDGPLEIELRNTKVRVYELTFDDGVSVYATKEQIVGNWHYWYLHRMFPGAPVLSNMVMFIAYKGNDKTPRFNLFKKNTHLNICGLMLWHIYYSMKDSPQYRDDDEFLWQVSQVCYTVTQNMFNASVDWLDEYSISLSLHDIVAMLDNKDIKAAKEEYLDTVTEYGYEESVTRQAITLAQDKIAKVLYDEDSSMPINGLKKLTLSDVISCDQVLQMVGPRGYVKEVSGKPFPYPIDVGYSEGLRTIYAIATESRSATEAVLSNEEPLRESEYHNRKINLSVTSIRSLIRNDCGSKFTVKHFVDDTDLPYLKGKFHMVDGIPNLIWDSIDGLIGKVIELRSVCKCANVDTQVKCSMCIGWLEVIVPKHTNLGNMLSTPLNQKVTSLILSVKHLMKSTVIKPIVLTNIDSKWFRLGGADNTKLFLNDDKRHQTIEIRIPEVYLPRLHQLQYADPNILPIDTFSSCPQFQIGTLDEEGMYTSSPDTLYLSVFKNGVHLSKYALKHIKNHGYATDKKEVVITIKNWSHDTPLFIVPKLGDNTRQFLEEVKDFIAPQLKQRLPKITDFKTPDAAIVALTTLLRVRIPDITFIQVEIYIHQCMVVDPDNDDWRLPCAGQEFVFMALQHVLANRSLSGMLAFEKQMDSLLSPKWQNKNLNGMHHILDDVLSL